MLKNVEICLPIDTVIADKNSEDAQTRIIQDRNIPAGWMGVDIGPGTVEAYKLRLFVAGTVIWNGPLGIFEKEPFARGTMAIANALADATDDGTITIIGGGDSAAAIKKAGIAERVTHVSTGGAAAMELLSGIPLPGVEVLSNI